MDEHILTINGGSSSVKFALFEVGARPEEVGWFDQKPKLARCSGASAGVGEAARQCAGSCDDWASDRTWWTQVSGARPDYARNARGVAARGGD